MSADDDQIKTRVVIDTMYMRTARSVHIAGCIASNARHTRYTMTPTFLD